MNPIKKYKEKKAAELAIQEEEQRQRILRLKKMEAAYADLRKGLLISKPGQKMKLKKEIKRLKKEIAAYEQSKRNKKIFKGSMAALIALICFCAIMGAGEEATEPTDPVLSASVIETTLATEETLSPTTVATQATEEPTVPTTEAIIETTAETEPATIATETLCVLPLAEQSTNTPPADSTFEIHYIDVGQADAALVLCDDEAMLIDGGNAEDSSLIYSYLKNHGINHLDYMVCTHAHEDHVGGLSGALNYATVDTAFCPVTSYDTKAFTSFVNYLAKQNVSITVPSHGDTFSLGSAECQIVGPIYGSDEPNNTSLVIKIVYGDTSFLFTGDAEREVEQDILNAGYDVSCTVLKVGHHGSDTSTSYVWLREAAPTYAVISVGDDNSYGHPTEDVLSRLRDAEVTTFRTDMQGTVICTSDGSTVSFEVERNADADTLANAGAGSMQATEAPVIIAEPEGAEGTAYIGNKNTKKFHYDWCSSVDSMKESNKYYYNGTRDEMIAKGYEPCKRCDP